MRRPDDSPSKNARRALNFSNTSDDETTGSLPWTGNRESPGSNYGRGGHMERHSGAYNVNRSSQSSSCNYEVATVDGASYSPSRDGALSSSWTQTLRHALSLAVHQSRVALSYVSPGVQFPMKCQALLHEHPHQRTFGLVVVCHRAGDPMPFSHSSYRQVGTTNYEKHVKVGRIRVTLLSRDFEADTVHGETSLSKEEREFRGNSFELQFACRYKKSAVPEGVFGKVLVERVTANETHKIFEFNLSKNCMRHSPLLNPSSQSDEKWSELAVTELAGMLQITEEENWIEFARRLGFTEHEIDTRFADRDKMAISLLNAYRERGGTAEEFVRHMYSVAQKLNQADDTSTVILQPPPSPRKRRAPSRPSNLTRVTPREPEQFPLGMEASYLGEIESNVAARSAVGGSPRKGGRNLTLPQSPPLTPQKRTQRHQECDTPSKRLRRISSGDSDFSFDFPSDNEIIPDDILRQISQHVSFEWRRLGSKLNLPEYEMDIIEETEMNLKENAYLMLRKWRQMFPTEANYRSLYTALYDTGLNGVAHQFCRSNSKK